MLYDKETSFSDNQAVTTTAASTNVVRMAAGPIKEVAFGKPIPLRIQVTEDFTGCTSIDFAVETSATEDFTSSKTLVSTGAVALANLKAGYVAPINYVPKGNEGYMRIKYTVVGTATAGKITAGLTLGEDGSYHEIAVEPTSPTEATEATEPTDSTDSTESTEPTSPTS